MTRWAEMGLLQNPKREICHKILAFPKKFQYNVVVFDWIFPIHRRLVFAKESLL